MKCDIAIELEMVGHEGKMTNVPKTIASIVEHRLTSLIPHDPLE